MDVGDGRGPTVRNITTRTWGSTTLRAKFFYLVFAVICGLLALDTLAAQQRPQLSNAVRAYVSIDAPVIALTHVRVIDGTGAPAREDQTVIISDSTIAAIGDFAATVVPEGATSLETYMQITRGELAAAINEAHRRGIKVTGHLCSVTYAEAAGLGIDNLEHGFFAATDFVADKKSDQCPGQGVGQKTIAALDENGAPFRNLVQTLIKANVALTSTLTVFETFTPGRPKPPGLEVLTPQLREQFEQNYARTSQNKDSIYSTLFAKGMALERAFAKAGGLLIAGTDPTGGGGVIPGFSNQRQVELLVDAGFSPLEAISISTLNGARYLGRDKSVGSIAVGKQADLVVLDGDPSTTIADVRKVEIVFRQGIGYDPAKLIASVSGKAGIW